MTTGGGRSICRAPNLTVYVHICIEGPGTVGHVVRRSKRAGTSRSAGTSCCTLREAQGDGQGRSGHPTRSRTVPNLISRSCPPRGGLSWSVPSPEQFKSWDGSRLVGMEPNHRQASTTPGGAQNNSHESGEWSPRCRGLTARGFEKSSRDEKACGGLSD